SILDEKGIFARKLLVNVTYHSTHLDSIADEYLHLMGDLSSQYPLEILEVKMVFSVTADIKDLSELCKGQYWVRNLLSPVKFCEALTHVCATYS
ncbi:polyketide synthase, partial [Varicellaria rhodocarpa]|nr:polyketide synthase [Varicellaria rhodocarpa]